MVCEEDKAAILDVLESVLILVLMEDGLREVQKELFASYGDEVLILVLMEDGLRETMEKLKQILGVVS